MKQTNFNTLQKDLLADAILCLHRERVAVRTECLRVLKNTADAPTPEQFGIPQLMNLLKKVHNMDAPKPPTACPKCCDVIISLGEAVPSEICQACGFTGAM